MSVTVRREVLAAGAGAVAALAALGVLLYTKQQKIAATTAAPRTAEANADGGSMAPSVAVPRKPTAAEAALTFPEVARPAKQKHILVTGGAGFVGSNLVDVLMLQGHVVHVMDNLFTGHYKNIQHWMGHPNFFFYQHDVIEPFSLPRLDELYHLACPASPPHYQFDPIKTIKTGTQGTLNMLGLAKKCGARLLLTSTSEIYGDPEIHPQRESYWGNVNTLGPRACYDEGKRISETMCYCYHHQHGVSVRIARIFNTFGPRMDPKDGRVVSNFMMQALKGEPLTIYGSGDQTRSFQYVSDLVRGLIKLMACKHEATPINLGNPEEFTVLEFADVILGMIPGTGSAIRNLPATQDDPRKRRPDITRAGELLGWAPITLAREGFEKTIEYFRGEIGAAKGPLPVVWMPALNEEGEEVKKAESSVAAGGK